MNLTNPGERTFIWLSAAGKSWGQHTRASAGTPSTQFRSAQSLSRVWRFATPWTVARQVSLSILLEFTQTCVHRVSDAIQSSHPLSSPSPPALNLSQHQGLFKWISSSHQVAKTGVSASTSFLPMNTQDLSPLGWTGWISFKSKELTRVLSNTTVQKHQFFIAQLFYSPTLISIHDYWKNHSFD